MGDTDECDQTITIPRKEFLALQRVALAAVDAIRERGEDELCPLVDAIRGWDQVIGRPN